MEEDLIVVVNSINARICDVNNFPSENDNLTELPINWKQFLFSSLDSIYKFEY